MSLGPLEIILAIIGISILVIVHESGHYLAARYFGMRVLTYSIGFGPTIFKYQKEGSPTVFKVGALPFLAYVQIAGMNPQEEVEADDPEIFQNQSLFARTVVIAAGPIANYLTASLFVFMLGLAGWPLWLPGTPRPDTEGMEVGTVQEGAPAEAAGLVAGDVIVEAAGRRIGNIGDLITEVDPRAGESLSLVVLRNGERMTVEVVPEDQDGHGKIGVGGQNLFGQYANYDVSTAAVKSIVYPWELSVLNLRGISRIFIHQETENIGGPVGMGRMLAGAAKVGPWDFFGMLVLLSVALGLFNLLPVPGLDGGHLSFLVYEAVTRRKPNEKFEAIVHTVGIVLLLGVIVAVTVRDIRGEPEPEAAPAEAAPAEAAPAEAAPAEAAPAEAAPAEAAPAEAAPEEAAPAE